MGCVGYFGAGRAGQIRANCLRLWKRTDSVSLDERLSSLVTFKFSLD